MRVLVVTALVLATATAENFFRVASPFTYTCKDSFCHKSERTQVIKYQSLQSCQLTCGRYGSIWPKPTGNVQLSTDTVTFNPENMRVSKIAVPDQEVSQMVEEAYRYFKRNTHFLHPRFSKSQKTPYTEEMKEIFTEINQGRIIQHVVLNQGESLQQQQQQQQPLEQQRSLNDFQTKTSENWERFSPFKNHKFSRNVDRQKINIEFTINNPVKKMKLDTDESYNLEVKTTGDDTLVSIKAPTYFGARHALETLSQLISYEESNEALMMVKDVTVEDKPQFKYRAFMLDTSRNFYPKEDIMQLMDAMSQNKMNYFHWHITDAASFPMYSETRPEMHYNGAYSPKKVYYPKDIQDIVEYARYRGIGVIPEINGPGNAHAGWQWGQKSGKGQLIVCADDQKPWFELGREAPSGHLNPVNPEVYNVLGDIYRDTVKYFDPEMVHMGGDSVSFKCWQNAKEIKEYLAENRREATSQEMFDLWNQYQTNAYSKLSESSDPQRPITPIIHSSSFVRSYIDKNTYIVQVNENANDAVVAQYVKDGFKVIFANLDQWRLDCLGTTWEGEKSVNCAKETPTWQHFYRNSPLDILATLGVPNTRAAQSTIKSQVLGGTVSLYSSETDNNGFQNKAWPRASAMAERLWSDPTVDPQGIDTTQKRLNIMRNRMVERGIKASGSQPEFCFQDESACYSQEEYQARLANIPSQ